MYVDTDCRPTQLRLNLRSVVEELKRYVRDYDISLKPAITVSVCTNEPNTDTLDTIATEATVTDEIAELRLVAWELRPAILPSRTATTTGSPPSLAPSSIVRSNYTSRSTPSSNPTGRASVA